MWQLGKHQFNSRFILGSGKYSLELIEIAYKDYPKPTTSTKLKFNVNYQAY